MKTSNLNLLIAITAALVVSLIAGVGILRRPDKWMQDRFFQQPGSTSPDILLIGIDENTLQELGPYNSWNRNIMAAALEILAADSEKRPAVVAIDTLYIGETDPEADSRLALAAANLPSVITASMAEFGTSYQETETGSFSVNSYSVLRYEKPYEALCAVTKQGHINAMYDTDGIMRHGILYVDVPTFDGKTKRVYSLAYEAARSYLDEYELPVKQPKTDRRGHFYIPYTGKPGSYSDGYSLSDLIQGELDPDIYAGKIVLIGPYAIALQDSYFTPISHAEQMFGVEISANIIQSILDHHFKQEMPDWPQLIALYLVSFGAVLLFLNVRLRSSVWLAIAILIASSMISLSLYALGWVTHVIWIPVAVITLFILAVSRHYVLSALEVLRVTHTFERYVAPEIVRDILKDGTDGLKLGGSLRNIAVLFVDIRGFTSMSERLDPEKVVFVLNRYLAVTSSCVERNGGTLDKFIGDCTMAFWGAPIHMEDPIYAAAKAAVDIVADTQLLSSQLKSEIGEELHVGVGIHYGPAVVGNMGSERHMDYSAIGDTVNTAARLESNAPGDTIYISRTIADALGVRAQTSSLGSSVHLKGKTEGFEVLTLDKLIPS